MNEKSELASFLRERRIAIEPSCNKFWEKNKSRIGVEEGSYLNYENGSRIPDVETLMRVAPLLKVEVRTLCHLWARAKMPNPQTREFFDGVPGYIPKTPLRPGADMTYRFSRNDIPQLRKYPELFVIAAILSTSSNRVYKASEIAKLIGLSASNTLEQLINLEKMGVITKLSSESFQSLYKDVSLPIDDDKFKDVRNRVYEVFFKILLQSFTLEKKGNKLAQKLSFTFKPTIENVKTVFSKLIEVESMVQHIRDEGETPYSLMILFSDIT